MKRIAKHLIVVSLDGLSTLDFEYITSLKNFKTLMRDASYCKKVYTVYPSLTYPAHASIITGRYPKNHGIINNTLVQVNRKSPDWYWQRSYIEGETVFDNAIASGMRVAALLWPVTAKSKIQYNLPEIFANRPWHNQVLVSLFNGSPLYQFELNSKFGHLRKGLSQPYLDNFLHASLLYTINTRKPDLTLVHYTDLDAMRHRYGFSSSEAKDALNRHDERLGDIIRTLVENGMYEDTALIILGDHSSLNENMVIRPNVLLEAKGFLDADSQGKIKDYKAICKTCDGSAYIYLKNRDDAALIEELRNLLDSFNTENNCIEFIYSSDAAEEMGADPHCSLMLEAQKGFSFDDGLGGEVVGPLHSSESSSTFSSATHGYSPLKDDYKTVFIASGKGIKKNVVLESMSLVDEGPTFARLLGIHLNNIDGRVLEELIE